MTGLLSIPGSYAIDALVAVGGLKLAAVETSPLGLPPYRCPYGLPAVQFGETVLVVSGWLLSLRHQGFDPVEQVLVPLRKKFDRIIGVDQADPFQLDFSDAEIDLMDVVLKVNGVYKDMDLYNFRVGSRTPDGRWTEKTRPREQPFSRENLSKVRLCVPCFFGTVPAVRAATRWFYCRSWMWCLIRRCGDELLARMSRPMTAASPPSRTVHFLASLTHVQRADALRRLRRSSLLWRGGITSVPASVGGLDDGIKALTASQRGDLTAQLRQEGLMAEPVNRYTYLRGMLDCKAVLSVTGYGEICFRMAEAWASRRVLVCQDLSHADILFPLSPGRNVVFCRPDLSDLTDVLEDVHRSYSHYRDIADRGYRDWQEWSRDSNRILREGFRPLFEV